ncbi:hypothetical protein ADZ37_12085 [Pannonibacter phragmitetus]|nr:hypothetical protein ADZ37_12085 [Pannonibacter phragmitetus]
MFAQPQPDQPERQQAAQLGAAFGGGHLVGRQGIRAFHKGLVREVSPFSYSPHSQTVPRGPDRHGWSCHGLDSRLSGRVEHNRNTRRVRAMNR